MVDVCAGVDTDPFAEILQERIQPNFWGYELSGNLGVIPNLQVLEVETACDRDFEQQLALVPANHRLVSLAEVAQFVEAFKLVNESRVPDFGWHHLYCSDFAAIDTIPIWWQKHRGIDSSMRRIVRIDTDGRKLVSRWVPAGSYTDHNSAPILLAVTSNHNGGKT